MDHQITCTWLEGMAFDVDLNGHHIMLDAAPDFGGKNRGPSPKPLLLASIAGCTGIDVVAILKKMRVPIEGMRIDVSATLTETDPKIYEKIKVIYYFKGNNLPMDKLEHAVQLSEEKYCGVSAMLKKASLIEYEIVLE
jgi:putative redox protein